MTMCAVCCGCVLCAVQVLYVAVAVLMTMCAVCQWLPACLLQVFYMAGWLLLLCDWLPAVGCVWSCGAECAGCSECLATYSAVHCLAQC